MNEFDLKAAGWDQNPMHWERSQAIANEIKRLIPLTKQMTALEFGAGTGITSFLLKDFLKEITLMDNSTEMVKVINEKIETEKVINLKSLNIDLEHSNYKENSFDLIFSQMALHHVADIENIVKKFYQLLNPGGYLAIADLFSEDGSFHGEGFTGHRGFDPIELAKLVSISGFQNISYQKSFVIKRPISDSESKSFDVFLLIANRG